MNNTKASRFAEARDWLRRVRDEQAQGLRFSGFTIALVLIIVLGVLLISPSVTTYVQQRAEIRDVQASLQQSQKSLDQAEAESKQWEDPAFVRAQARERLYYVMPGETQIGVIQDMVLPKDNTDATSNTVKKADVKWEDALLASVLQSGTATPQTGR